VNLLRCLKASLEDDWYPTIPFQGTHFMLASIPPSRVIEREQICGQDITCALLCTVHESKSQRDVQIYGASSPPVTVQDIVPPHRKKNEHTPGNLHGKCPMIVPVFFYSHGIDLST